MKTRTHLLGAMMIVASLYCTGCQSPLVGTWIETSGPLAVSDQNSLRQSAEVNWLVFKRDGTSVEYSIRNGHAQRMIPATYRIKGDILITEDEPGWGCIRSQFVWRYRIQGEKLVLDDGQTPAEYDRID